MVQYNSLVIGHYLEKPMSNDINSRLNKVNAKNELIDKWIKLACLHSVTMS